jgi:hypothetical protein
MKVYLRFANAHADRLGENHAVNTMRQFLIISFILTVMVCSCTQRIGEKNSTKMHTALLSKAANIHDQDEIRIAPGLTIDTIAIFDSSKNTQIFIQCPLSTSGNTSFNQLIKIDLQKQLDSFLNELEIKRPVSGRNEFTINLVSCYLDSNFMSCCFTVSGYQYAAVHPFTIYYSFNYNLEEDRRVFFADYFQLRGETDRAAFRAILNSAIGRPVNFGISYLENVCFVPENDTIVFYFDDFYEKNDAAQITKATVPKKNLVPYISRHFR